MTQYCGIIITETELYISVTKRIGKKLKVLQRYTLQRTDDIILDLSIVHRSNANCPTIYAIVYKETPQLILQAINTDSPLQLAVELKENLILENYPNYAYQYLLPTINHQQWVYLVGISQSKLDELKKANEVNHMETDVVSYWPVPLLDLHRAKQNPILLLIEENNIVTGYLCHGFMITAKTDWDKNNESPMSMIQRLIDMSPIKVDDTLKVQAYLNDDSYSVWEYVINEYGKVDTDTIIDVVNHFTHQWYNNVYMDASAGLSYYLARSGVQSEEL